MMPGTVYNLSHKCVLAGLLLFGITSVLAVMQDNPEIARHHVARTMSCSLGVLALLGATQQEPRRRDGGRSAQDATATPVITIGYASVPASINPENNSDAIAPVKSKITPA